MSSYIVQSHMSWTEHEIGNFQSGRKTTKIRLRLKAQANTYTQNRKKLKEVSNMTNYYKTFGLRDPTF